MAEAEVGSSVLFGAYEQDNDESNGKELVEWTVLAIVCSLGLVRVRI